MLASRGVFRHIAYFAPAIVLYLGVGEYSEISSIARRVILAYLVVNVAIILDRLLSAGLDIYRMYPVSMKRPIKSYVQLAKLTVYILAAVTTIAVLLNKSPWGILGGITAMTAVLILVFRHKSVQRLVVVPIDYDDRTRLP